MENQAKELDFKGRVREEKRQLDENIKKLQRFVEDKPENLKKDIYSLPSEEQHDLKRQLRTMEEYSMILQRRINRFD